MRALPQMSDSWNAAIKSATVITEAISFNMDKNRHRRPSNAVLKPEQMQHDKVKGGVSHYLRQGRDGQNCRSRWTKSGIFDPGTANVRDRIESKMFEIASNQKQSRVSEKSVSCPVLEGMA
jgi:hypothetical protein